ncbi:MAG: hypothetical protein ACREQ5_37780, partial [Candidatus Dormibacteria bacterium]
MMFGRRIQHVKGQDPYHELTQPGDYCGPIYGYTGEVPAVFFIIPEPAPWEAEVSEFYGVTDRELMAFR